MQNVVEMAAFDRTCRRMLCPAILDRQHPGNRRRQQYSGNARGEEPLPFVTPLEQERNHDIAEHAADRARCRAHGAKAAPSARIGASVRLARMIRRRPTRSASRARSIEPKADSDIHANRRASAGWLRWKLFAIQGEAMPETESV